MLIVLRNYFTRNVSMNSIVLTEALFGITSNDRKKKTDGSQVGSEFAGRNVNNTGGV